MFKLLPIPLLTYTVPLVMSSVANAATSTQDVAENTSESSVEKIVVTADFRSVELTKLPSSTTVIDQQQMADEGAQHFEDILNGIANFNWSGGSSRPQYFQIRGVGEQEQYQGAPNSSVGYVIDGVDVSGLGMVSSLYDMQQVEVLRGPQGTRYGGNALAGLIYLKSNDPSEVFEHGAELSLGGDDLRTFSGYSSGPLTNSGELLYRVAIQQHRQDGFRDNQYLNRDDTNGRDELSTRAKLRWYANDDLQVDVTLMHANFDNGYDAWTLDNNGFDTLTDVPGIDTQQTNGMGITANYTGYQRFDITSLTSYADTDHRYGYDGDWANPQYWAERQCLDEYDENGNGQYDDQIGCVYDYTWDKKGDRRTWTQEVRVRSTEEGRLFGDTTDWLAGVYVMDLRESNDLYSEYNTYPDEVLLSHYEATNYAAFVQFDSDLGADYELSVGYRLEQRRSDYRDSNGDDFSPRETMWGGHVSLSKALNSQHQAYLRVARGYKAGGFNMTLPTELADKKEFDTEVMYNYELGFKSQWLNGDLTSNLALFYMDRRDQQVAASQQDPARPQRFILYTENASGSENYGAELDMNWYVSNQLTVYSTFGWLETSYDDYLYQDKYGSLIDLSGRELAHSPNYTYSLGMTYRADNGWFVNVNNSGKSDFYYSDSNDSQSKGYGIVSAKVGYETPTWSAYLWGRNVFDKAYGVRGFYFGNEPDIGWVDKQYIRYGAPQLFGLTLNYALM